MKTNKEHFQTKTASEQMREVRGYAIISKGGTPAEAAGIKLEFGRNKLLWLIKYIAKQKHHSLR